MGMDSSGAGAGGNISHANEICVFSVAGRAQQALRTILFINSSSLCNIQIVFALGVLAVTRGTVQAEPYSQHEATSTMLKAALLLLVLLESPFQLVESAGLAFMTPPKPPVRRASPTVARSPPPRSKLPPPAAKSRRAPPSRLAPPLQRLPIVPQSSPLDFSNALAFAEAQMMNNVRVSSTEAWEDWRCWENGACMQAGLQVQACARRAWPVCRKSL